MNKRIAVIIMLFVLMIGFSVSELIIHRHVYGVISGNLSAISKLLDDEDTDKEALTKMDRTLSYWDSRRRLMASFSNSDVIRFIDENLIRLRGLIAEGKRSEARIQLTVTQNYIDQLIDELDPLPGNII